MLDLRVLGGFGVALDSDEINELAAQPTRAALLVFLAMEKTTTRETVLALLWPDHDPQKARHALSQTLHRLRSALGERWLEVEGEKLATSSSVRIDAREFMSLAEQERYDDALDLYQGPFLDGWFFGDCPAFERWSDQQRARLERTHRLTCREALRTRRERGDFAGALAIAQEWAKLDPLEDEAQHRLIELLAESGRRADALAQFDVHRELLESEGLTPLDDTVQLVERLRQADDVGSLDDDPASEVPDTPPARPGRMHGPGHAVWRLTRYVGTALFALTAIFVVLVLIREYTPEARALRAALPEGGRLVLADFGNDTHDTLVAGVVTEALRIDLKRFLHSGLVDPAEVGGILARMERSPLAPLTGETAREVALRAGVPAVIDGRVGAVGPGFVLSAWVVSTENGQVIEAALATARDSAELLDAIEALCAQLRGVIRPSLEELPEPTSLAQVTTSSLDALRRYTLALHAWQREGDGLRAVQLLDEATRLDTAFAMAYRTRAMVLMNIGAERRLWVDALTAAFRHRDHLSDWERYITVATYRQSVTNELDQAMTAYQSLLELDSTDVTALNNLGVAYREQRDYARAEPLFRRCLEVDSAVLSCAVNLCGVVHGLGRRQEAEAIARRLVERYPRNPFAFAQLSWIASAAFDYAAADSLFTGLAGFDLPNPGALEVWLAYVDMVRGRLGEARAHLDRGYQIAGRSVPLTATMARHAEAWIELEILGDTARAVATMRAVNRDSILSDLDPVDVPYTQLADFYAAAGRLDLAEAELDTFAAALPVEMRRPAERRLHSVRGLIALERGDLNGAREAFRLADRHEGGSLVVQQYAGPTQELAGHPDSAITAYEAYLSNPQMVRLPYDAVLMPKVLERLAQLHEAAGHAAEAARYYTRFADLWADADPELRPRADAARRRARALLASDGSS